ncbi:MAG: VacJ family lipoprotein [Pseudomonadota bacterium]|nr:VacJ family lipoprotein [Pseudomonadota bacterium]
MRFRQILLVLLCAGLLPACASLPPGERDPRDPFERFNRSMYRVNDALDRGVARPAAKAYVKVTPAPVRTGVSNFFRNLNSTTVIANNLLQLKPKGFFTETARLVVNTTIGIGGLFDPATQLGLPSGDEDFGQTLGRWGVKSGPYIVLPALGPSSVRDTVGLVGDQFTDPKYYLIDKFWINASLTVLSLVDTRAGLLGTDEVLASSFDPYVFMRNAYLQRREFQVTDGAAAPETEEFEIFEFDEEEFDEEPPAEAQAPAPQ